MKLLKGTGYVSGKDMEFSLHGHFQTGSETHAGCYPMGTGVRGLPSRMISDEA